MASADERTMAAFTEALTQSLALNVELIEMITSLAPPRVRERPSFHTILSRVEQLKEMRSFLLGLEGEVLQ